MTTLGRAVLSTARVVSEVMAGTATAATASSLTDTIGLTQPNQYWTKGTVWILSGAHNGKVFPVSGFSANTISITPTLAPVLENTVAYAVARAIYPWMALVSAVNQALEECVIIDDDDSIVGDGSTLIYTLPSGVERIAYIEIESPQGERTAKNHWKQRDTELHFDYGHAPLSGYTVHLMHKIVHPILNAYSDLISNDVNTEWLRWKAAEYALYWAVGTYGEAKEYRIEEYMNRAMTKQKGLYPVKPTVTVRTAS